LSARQTASVAAKAIGIGMMRDLLALDSLCDGRLADPGDSETPGAQRSARI